jgi:fructose transport system substrate-binding protein
MSGKHTSRLAALAAILPVAALGVAACGGGDSGGGGASGGGDVQIGLITKTDTNPFFVKMKDAAQAAAQKDGATLISAAGKFDGDNQSQVTAIENMIARGVKGIMITPSDTKAIVPSIKKARDQGIEVIALDTPTQPQSATDALFATNNFKAGELIGEYAKAKFKGKQAKIAMLDLAPGISVGVLRHNGFLKGFGISNNDRQIVGSADTQGDQAKGQTAMETLLQKDPGINLVYTINEPAAAGAYTALKQAGKDKQAMIVSIDGGCTGVGNVKKGVIAATSQQYPKNMAQDGVKAIVNFAKTGKKVSGYTDTGVNLITDQPVKGVPSKDTAYGTANCWG